MVAPYTARKWYARFSWPIILSTGWFVLYTSLVVFNLSFANTPGSVFAFLFSSEHLSHPLGWAFLLSLIGAVTGALFKAYLLVVG